MLFNAALNCLTFILMSPREQQFRKNCDVLKKYIPEAAVGSIAEWIVTYDFKLKIKIPRHKLEGA